MEVVIKKIVLFLACNTTQMWYMLLLRSLIIVYKWMQIILNNTFLNLTFALPVQEIYKITWWE